MSFVTLVKDVVTIYKTLGSGLSEDDKIDQIVKILSTSTDSTTPKPLVCRNSTKPSVVQLPLSPVPAPLSPVRDNDPKGIEPPLPPFDSEADTVTDTTSVTADVPNKKTGTRVNAKKAVSKPSISWEKALEEFDSNEDVSYCMWGFNKNETVCGVEPASEKKTVPLCNKCYEKKTKNPLLTKLKKDSPVKKVTDPNTKFFGLPIVKGVPILSTEEEPLPSEPEVIKTPNTFIETEETAPEELMKNVCKNFNFIESKSDSNVTFLVNKNVSGFENTPICMGLLSTDKVESMKCVCCSDSFKCDGVLEMVDELDPSQESLIKELLSFSIKLYQHGGKDDIVEILF